MLATEPIGTSTAISAHTIDASATVDTVVGCTLVKVQLTSSATIVRRTVANNVAIIIGLGEFGRNLHAHTTVLAGVVVVQLLTTLHQRLLAQSTRPTECTKTFEAVGGETTLSSVVAWIARVGTFEIGGHLAPTTGKLWWAQAGIPKAWSIVAGATVEAVLLTQIVTSSIGQCTGIGIHLTLATSVARRAETLEVVRFVQTKTLSGIILITFVSNQNIWKHLPRFCTASTGTRRFRAHRTGHSSRAHTNTDRPEVR